MQPVCIRNLAFADVHDHWLRLSICPRLSWTRWASSRSAFAIWRLLMSKNTGFGEQYFLLVVGLDELAAGLHSQSDIC